MPLSLAWLRKLASAKNERELNTLICLDQSILLQFNQEKVTLLPKIFSRRSFWVNRGRQSVHLR